MKRLLIIAVAVVALTQVVRAQGNSYFDDKGAIRLETVELDEAADTLVTLFHRVDDIVWSRVVYRVIDMRYKQNYQLYFPVKETKEYRSLFRVMLDALLESPKNPEDSIHLYEASYENIRPDFAEDKILRGMDLSRRFANNEAEDGSNLNENNLIKYDSIDGSYYFDNYAYEQYVRNQIKFVIQEVYFFDKHTSRMHSQIIAIAPLYALHPDNLGSATDAPMETFLHSIVGWYSFKELRKALAKQYIIPKGNDSHRVTFDEFFAKKLYSSYLLGDSNMFDRMIIDYQKYDMNLVKREQERIETELLNFEQDLWEN
ncbi:MAG: gliding motility protein GldN [Paludibacteraceae bacterium]|nr:gliding motility protein GldN [Paludibacteraceae bacterium]